MATAEAQLDRGVRRSIDPRSVRWYCVGITSGFVVALAIAYLADPAQLTSAFIVFVLVAAAADAMRIEIGREMTFAVSLPVVLAACMVLAPWQAALVGFFGTADLREVRREVPLPRALFNRSLVGLCALVASAVFHAIGGDPLVWPGVLWASLVALSADMLVNAGLVVWPVAKLRSSTVSAVLHGLLQPDPRWSALRYVCTGLMAPMLAAAWLFAGVFGLLVGLLPLALAWLSFREAGDLSEARSTADARKRALAAAVEETAAERHDERRSIAGDLHDEVLPALYKVHLMGEVIRHDLANGRLLDLETDVTSLLEATNSAQLATRNLVGSLRGSPLGSRGLEGTLRAALESLDALGAPTIELKFGEISGPEAVQIVAFQVVRESVTNAAKYAKAQRIEAVVDSVPGRLIVEVRDDGVGFDALHSTAIPGHFGLSLMRERVEAVGGSLVLHSQLGGGTTVQAMIPTAIDPA